MRNRVKKDGLTINAIAGTYVVFLAFDLVKEKTKDFMGFAIRRTDHADGETVWLRGMKTFSKTAPHPAPGETFSSLRHPIQGFQWADYSAKPGNRYTYQVHCMYGAPESLQSLINLDIEITSEIETGPKHSVFFNRGSVATQEYARRFQNKKPSVAGQGAYDWLSRGLIEALIAFIARAKSGYSLRGAVYEFQYPKVLAAIKGASDQGADVKIIFDDVESYDDKHEPTGPWHRNREEISTAGIAHLCSGRSNAKLMHNKFFILSKGSKPIAVWTGSTNLTENGIFGHSNLGHIVEDEVVANSFMAYWDRLAGDPAIASAYRNENMVSSPVPQTFNSGTTTIFSPRGTKLDALDWYAKIAAEAKDGLFMTFAFGMHEKFRQVYRTKDEILRMALLEKAYGNAKVRERDEADTMQIRKLPNVVIAIGNRIVTNAFDRWLEEMYSVDGKRKHVYWIHTKYMLVDPLGDNPIVVSGSANFSKASTDTNDENMLIIKGDKRIADIYFGEYIRLFAHYSFRESVKRALDNKTLGKPELWTPQYLETKDTWLKDYYEPKGRQPERYYRRIYFASPLTPTNA